MGIKESFKILEIISQVRSSSWQIVMAIVDSINNDKKTKVIKAEWADSYKREHPDRYPLDLSTTKTWSTFDGACIDLRFVVEDKKLKCYALIYDGDNFDGRRENLRFLAEIQLQNDFIKELKYSIEFGFKNYLNVQYENYLELQRQEWIRKERNTLLLGYKVFI